MKRRMIFVVCLILVAFAQAACAQNSTTAQAPANNLPVSYVYVSGGTVNNSEIYAFEAASDGKLTPVSGSPFRGLTSLGTAVNGKYLFGTDEVYIYTFAIASDGAIKQVATINAQQYNNPNFVGGPAALFVDRTGATLYDFDIHGYNGTNGDYQSFGIDDSTGELTYLGVSSSSNWFFDPLSFIGNNVDAYGASCIADLYWTIYGFQRNSDGTLSALNINPRPPKAKEGDFYCPNLTATDQTNHVAISMQAVNGNFEPDGLPQLAAYTADKSGNLTTKNTHFNMPHTAIQYLFDMRMSPSGKLLAVGGAYGLQVFHFNGSEPITHYTGLLTGDEIQHLSWDNDNHLYAITSNGNELFVFTVTPTSVRQALGSPYTIPQPMNIAVLPRN
jgi:WD40 repeat protein